MTTWPYEGGNRKLPRCRSEPCNSLEFPGNAEAILVRVTRLGPNFAVELSHRADEVMQRIRSGTDAVQLDCLLTSAVPCVEFFVAERSVASGHDIGPYESMMQIVDWCCEEAPHRGYKCGT